MTTLFKRLAEQVKGLPALIKPVLSQFLHLGEFAWRQLSLVDEELEATWRPDINNTDIIKTEIINPKIIDDSIGVKETTKLPVANKLTTEKWLENNLSPKNTPIYHAPYVSSDNNFTNKKNTNDNLVGYAIEKPNRSVAITRDIANKDSLFPLAITRIPADPIIKHDSAKTAISITPVHETTHKPLISTSPAKTAINPIVAKSAINKKLSKPTSIRPVTKESVASYQPIKNITLQPEQINKYQQSAPHIVKITIDRIKIKIKASKSHLEKKQPKQPSTNTLKPISLVDYLTKSRSS